MREEEIWADRHSRMVRLSGLETIVGPKLAQDKEVLMCTTIGDHDKETLTILFDRVLDVLRENAPVLMLNDMREIGETSLASKWYAADRLKQNRPFLSKSAVFGASPTLVAAGSAILRVAGRDDIRLFNGQPEALAWLLADD